MPTLCLPGKPIKHRRRMETDAKAKVVASVWGANFIQFLAALPVLPRSIWKKRLNSSTRHIHYSSNCPCIKTVQNRDILNGFRK